jgi:hypothetical protein
MSESNFLIEIEDKSERERHRNFAAVTHRNAVDELPAARSNAFEYGKWLTVSLITFHIGVLYLIGQSGDKFAEYFIVVAPYSLIGISTILLSGFFSYINFSHERDYLKIYASGNYVTSSNYYFEHKGLSANSAVGIESSYFGAIIFGFISALSLFLTLIALYFHILAAQS